MQEDLQTLEIAYIQQHGRFLLEALHIYLTLNVACANLRLTEILLTHSETHTPSPLGHCFLVLLEDLIASSHPEHIS